MYSYTLQLSNTSLLDEKHPKVLGVTFDPTLTFSTHVDNFVKKSKSRLAILKALTGSTWGQHKESVVITYKISTRPLFTYATPIWFPHTSQTNITKL